MGNSADSKVLKFSNVDFQIPSHVSTEYSAKLQSKAKEDAIQTQRSKKDALFQPRTPAPSPSSNGRQNVATPSRTTHSMIASIPRRPRFNLSDFELLVTLGTGSYGRVKLVVDKGGKHFALKCLKKMHIIKSKQIDHITNEKRILKALSHPFLVNLHGTFQDEHKVYLLMDFIPGGELFTYLRKAQRFSNEVAKFFAAQLVLIFEYLQSLSIAHRDLKPENLLLDTEGYIRLTDFGFAKVVTERTYTVCGTPEYLSPEMILSRGHNSGTDWWSLGVLIYEMLVGRTPFYADKQFRVFEKILAGRVKFPTFVHPDAVDLITNLLTADRTRRLGMLRGGAQDVKRHPWFNGVDWNALTRKEIIAPIAVRLSGPGDTRNFPKYPRSVEISEPILLTREQQAKFADF